MIGIDEKCAELADHFLAEVPGVTEEIADELAEMIQSTIEDFIASMKERANAHP